MESAVLVCSFQLTMAFQADTLVAGARSLLTLIAAPGPFAVISFCSALPS